MGGLSPEQRRVRGYFPYDGQVHVAKCMQDAGPFPDSSRSAPPSAGPALGQWAVIHTPQTRIGARCVTIRFVRVARVNPIFIDYTQIKSVLKAD